MSNKVFHVTVYVTGRKQPDLTSALDTLEDWILYAPNCWMVWTAEDPDTVREKLQRAAGGHGHVLLIEMNNEIDVYGYLPKGIWDWLQKHGFAVTTET